METIKVRTYIADDGILQVQLPSEIVNQELDVVIVFQPVIKKSAELVTEMQEELGYSREFIEEVVGSWEGEPLERPEQLPFEVREEIQWPIY